MLSVGANCRRPSVCRNRTQKGERRRHCGTEQLNLEDTLKDNLMNGKICLVTGATNGIGRATAQALAHMGATVIIVGRDAQKTSRVVEEIRAASGNNNVDSLLADLSSQQQVRRLANEFKSKYSHLHVLLNNAGAVFMRHQ